MTCLRGFRCPCEPPRCVPTLGDFAVARTLSVDSAALDEALKEQYSLGLSASRFLMELLKQGAQRERRPARAVRHDWHRVIARTVDLPVQDNGARIALVALLAAPPRPTYRPRAAWAPRARDELPARPRTSAGLILACDE